MSTATSQDRGLVRDEGGAIMIMGLAMILGLIAFLWFLLGIGETIAFRDHMQDSADAAAFSQAAVEAAGMNVIVLINMLILLIVAVYMVMSISVTADWASTIGTCTNIFTVAYCPVKVAAYIIHWKNRNGTAGDMSDADRVLSELESGVALLAPWAGTAAGIDASSAYKMSSMASSPIGLSISANNVPDMEALTSGGQAVGPEYGLPVTHEHLGNDCAHIMDIAGGLIDQLLPDMAASILNAISGALGAMVQWYYCSNRAAPPGIPMPSFDFLGGVLRLIIGGGDGGGYWDADGYGPMVNYNHKNPSPMNFFDFAMPSAGRHDKEQKNGADHNQSYSFVVIPDSFEDKHATHNIAFMQLHNAGWATRGETKPTPLFYFAQAELYFDCGDAWRTGDCDNLNGSLDRMDMTMYRFEWRARLVKFHPPAGGLTKAYSLINRVLSMVTNVKGWINGGATNPFIQSLQFLQRLTGIDFIAKIASVADIPPSQVFH